MKAISNFRYYILVATVAVAVVGVFSAPCDDLSLLAWLWSLISTKAVGFGACYLTYYLTKRWHKKGSINELTQFLKEL